MPEAPAHGPGRPPRPPARPPRARSGDLYQAVGAREGAAPPASPPGGRGGHGGGGGPDPPLPRERRRPPPDRAGGHPAALGAGADAEPGPPHAEAVVRATEAEGL